MTWMGFFLPNWLALTKALTGSPSPLRGSEDVRMGLQTSGSTFSLLLSLQTRELPGMVLAPLLFRPQRYTLQH